MTSKPSISTTSSSDSCGCPDVDTTASIAMAVITLSDSRTAAEDRSGQAVVDALQSVGHTVVSRHLLTDDAEPLRQLLERLRDDESVEAIITTGGTGVAKRDLAIDVIESMLDVTLPGFGETFRRVSFDEIGPKAMLSRATAGRLGDTMVFALPGSTGGVRTAMTQCVLPILVHAVRLAQR